jgi:ribosomal protein S18 acetylase RimI-like enzyme
VISEHEIALATLNDAQPIAELSRDVIEYGLPWRWTPQRVSQAIQDRSTNVLVVRRGAYCLAGFALMQYGDETAHLSLLAVREAQRRLGMGAALLQWLEASARVAGIQTLRLEVRASNPGAMAFYGRMGFVHSGIRTGYYDGLEDAMRMAKRLAPD